MRVTLSHVLRHRRHVALKKTPPEKFPAIDAGADSTNQVNWADDPTIAIATTTRQKEGRAHDSVGSRLRAYSPHRRRRQ
jgi:hypothetical protein